MHGARSAWPIRTRPLCFCAIRMWKTNSLTLPEDVRVELTYGWFYDREAAATLHQSIGMRIMLILDECIKKHGRSCVPFIATKDVQLDRISG